MGLRVAIDWGKLTTFCKAWKVSELAVFGSVLRDDFGPESDIDVLVEFEPGAGLDFFDLLAMTDELSEILGRHVDLVTKRSLRPRLRDVVLPTSQVLYAS